MDLAEQQARFKAQPFARSLGIELADVSAGFARLKMVVNKDHLTMYDTAQGGILATIADAACSWALWQMLEPDELFTSLEFKVNYLSPARLNESIFSDGRILQRGRRISVGDMEVREEASNRLILKGIQTFLSTKR